MKHFEITWLNEVASTNDFVRGLPARSVVVARRQTAGRGQRGNTWSSEEGQNLTFSMLLDTSFLPAAGQFLLSEVVALAVVDILREFGIDAMVKWPNDIYVGARKIAGILIENDIRGEFLSRSVVGVGLNVNQTVFPAELPNPTSMSLELGTLRNPLRRQRHCEEPRGTKRDEAIQHVAPQDCFATGAAHNDEIIDLGQVLDAFLSALERRLGELERGELPEADYVAKLWRRGVEALYALPGGEHFRGTIRGVLPTGELILDTAAGERRFLFKEMEFVL